MVGLPSILYHWSGRASSRGLSNHQLKTTTIRQELRPGTAHLQAHAIAQAPVNTNTFHRAVLLTTNMTAHVHAPALITTKKKLIKPTQISDKT